MYSDKKRANNQIYFLVLAHMLLYIIMLKFYMALEKNGICILLPCFLALDFKIL